MTKLKLLGRLDGAIGGSMTIDRERILIGVRPKGRHRIYELPIQFVAEMIIAKVVKQEIQAMPKRRRR